MAQFYQEVENLRDRANAIENRLGYNSYRMQISGEGGGYLKYRVLSSDIEEAPVWSKAATGYLTYTAPAGFANGSTADYSNSFIKVTAALNPASAVKKVVGLIISGIFAVYSTDVNGDPIDLHDTDGTDRGDIILVELGSHKNTSLTTPTS